MDVYFKEGQRPQPEITTLKKNLEFRTYNPLALAMMIAGGLRETLDQIAAVLIALDGKTLKIGLRQPDASRTEVGTYEIPDGYHAVFKVYRDDGTGVLQTDGTPGVLENPGLPIVLAWADKLMVEASEDTLYCGAPEGAERQTYLAKVDAQKPEALEFVTPAGLVQVTALPGGGFVGRSQGKANTVAYLTPETAAMGNFAIGNWAYVQVPGVQNVDHLPERIDDENQVCVSTTTDGRPSFDLLNLAQIGKGEISNQASNVGNAAVRYLGTTGMGSDFAVLQASHAIDGFELGVVVVPRRELASTPLGQVGEQIAQAS